MSREPLLRIDLLDFTSLHHQSLETRVSFSRDAWRVELMVFLCVRISTISTFAGISKLVNTQAHHQATEPSARPNRRMVLSGLGPILEAPTHHQSATEATTRESCQTLQRMQLILFHYEQERHAYAPQRLGNPASQESSKVRAVD